MENNTIIILFAIIATFFMVLYFFKDIIRYKLAKPNSVQAVVISKEEKVISAMRTNYIVKFQVEDDVLTLMCDKNFHDGLDEGDRGTLTYQGSFCTGFVFSE